MHEADTDIFHIIKGESNCKCKKGKSNILSFHTNVAVTYIFQKFIQLYSAVVIPIK